MTDRSDWLYDRIIASDTKAARLVLDEMLQQLEARDWQQREIFAVHLAMEEALVNAICHGNCSDAEERPHRLPPEQRPRPHRDQRRGRRLRPGRAAGPHRRRATSCHVRPRRHAHAHFHVAGRIQSPRQRGSHGKGPRADGGLKRPAGPILQRNTELVCGYLTFVKKRA